MRDSTLLFTRIRWCIQGVKIMEALLVSITDTAKALNLGRTSIYTQINEGKLETRKMGRRRLVTVASIKRLAGEQE
jgi:hypothetical protein